MGEARLSESIHHSFNRYLLSTYYAPGTVTGESVVNKTGQVITFMCFHSAETDMQ